MKRNSERKKWNDENIKRVTDALIDANYRSTALYSSSGTATIEIWVGPGSAPILALQRYDDDMGFDVWKPVSQSNLMDDMIRELGSLISNIPAPLGTGTSQT